jgi:hypothetical protein
MRKAATASLSVLRPTFQSHLMCSLCWRTKSFSFVSACGPRDEPARHDGGLVPRVGPHHERCPGDQQGPSNFFSLVSLRTVQLLQECSGWCPQTCGKFFFFLVYPTSLLSEDNVLCFCYGCCLILNNSYPQDCGGIFFEMSVPTYQTTRPHVP